MANNTQRDGRMRRILTPQRVLHQAADSLDDLRSRLAHRRLVGAPARTRSTYRRIPA